MRILVTNDDGIDSVGLAVLARAMRRHGDVVVVAPDREQSGAGAAIGPVHLFEPEVHRAEVDGIDEAWMVSGMPALCVFLARMHLFGEPPDLVVAGINPGANVGRSVYHSGTVGAALTARSGGITGVAVSQQTSGSIEGQAYEDVVANQIWETAAVVADAVVGGLIIQPPDRPVVANVNVPNASFDELKGWKETEVGHLPSRALTTASMQPIEGRTNSFRVKMSYGELMRIPPDLDGGAVDDGYVSISWLSHLTNEGRAPSGATAALDALLTR